MPYLLLALAVVLLWLPAGWSFELLPRGTSKTGFPPPKGAALDIAEFDGNYFALAAGALARSTTQTLTAAAQINCSSNAIVPIAGSGGSVNLTSNPQIATPTDLPVTKFCVIEGTSDTNTVILETGNGLVLPTASITVTNNLLLLFVFNGTSWVLVSSAGAGGGGSGTDATYLVASADATLTNEVIVGTTPGGELGGTWASPTVDTTHAGSSHASVQAAAEATAATALSAHAADTTGIHGITDTSALLATSSSITVAQLATILNNEDYTPGSKTSTEGSVALPNLQGVLTVAKGGTGAAPGAGDQVLVSDSTSAGTWKTIPDCHSGNMLSYTQATNTWSCETDDTEGAGSTDLQAAYNLGKNIVISSANLTGAVCIGDGLTAADTLWCVYVDGTGSTQTLACDGARGNCTTLGHRNQPGSNWPWTNDEGDTCLTWNDTTYALTVSTTNNCADAFTVTGNLAVSGTISTPTIVDSNGNELLIFTTTAAAVNELTIANGATGVSPKLTASGETNVGIDFQSKGTSPYRFLSTATAATQIRMFEQTTNGSNFIDFQAASALGSNINITLPSSTDTLVGRATTDTLTNKTLTAPVITTSSGTVGITTISSTPYTLLATDCGKFLNITTGASEIDLLADMTGCLICLFQTNAVATILDPNSTDTWLVGSYNNETGSALAPAAGDSITLAAGADNALCFVGVSATQIRLLPGTLGAVSDTN